MQITSNANTRVWEVKGGSVTKGKRRVSEQAYAAAARGAVLIQVTKVNVVINRLQDGAAVLATTYQFIIQDEQTMCSKWIQVPMHRRDTISFSRSALRVGLDLLNTSERTPLAL